MELLTLSYFIKTAETQHMSNAAAELNISQSALSTKIKKLEEELGVRLFDRRGKYIYLNEYGKKFLEYAQSIVNQYNSAKIMLHSMKSDSENKISVSMPALTSFPGLMNHIKNNVPNIVFRNIQTNHTERVNMLLNKNVAFCIMGAKLENPNIHETLISVDNLVILAPSSCDIAKKKEIDLIELKDYKFANVNRRAAADVAEAPTTDLEMYCRKAGFEPKIVYWCDQFYELIDSIRDGQFLGMAAERILPGYNLNGISVIRVSNPQCYSNLRLYRLKDYEESKTERLVRESIMEYFMKDEDEMIDYRELNKK